MNMFKVLEKIGTGRTTGHYMYYIKKYTFCIYIYSHPGVDRMWKFTKKNIKMDISLNVTYSE